MSWNFDLVVRASLGVATALISYLGYMLSKAGRADTARQQNATNELQRRVNTVEELESAVEVIRTERDHWMTMANEADRKHQDERARQAHRCADALDRCIDQIATLQTIVGDEIARAAALETVQDTQDHQETDHDRVFPDDDTPGGSVRY